MYKEGDALNDKAAECKLWKKKKKEKKEDKEKEKRTKLKGEEVTSLSWCRSPNRVEILKGGKKLREKCDPCNVKLKKKPGVSLQSCTFNCYLPFKNVSSSAWDQ